MQAKILTFGILKSAFSVSSVNLSDGATVADLIAVLRRDLEERSLDADLLKGIAISVNA